MNFKTYLEKIREKPTVYAFDIDDTLVKSDAKVWVVDANGEKFHGLTAKEFNTYRLRKGQDFDFSEFNSADVLNSTGKKTEYWKVAQNISDAIQRGDSNSELFIITARPYKMKQDLFKFLFKNGLRSLKQKNVYALGELNNGKTIAQLKKEVLSDIKSKHGEVWFFDDDTKNIELAKALDSIKTRHVKI